MRLGSIGLAMLATAIGAAAPAATTQAGGDANEARRTMRVYLECLVKGAGSGAAHKRLVAFLGQSPNAPGANAAGRALATPDCLRMAATVTTYVSRLRFQPALLRGEAFRGLYLQRVARPDRVVVAPAEIQSGWSTEAGDVAGSLRGFGDCVVRLDRAGADAAVRAGVGSEEEAAAYRALGSTLSRCVAPDSTLRFSRAVLEGVLAESLYRQATGVLDAPAAPGTN